MTKQYYENGKPVAVIPQEEYDALIRLARGMEEFIEGLVNGYKDGEE